MIKYKLLVISAIIVLVALAGLAVAMVARVPKLETLAPNPSPLKEGWSYKTSALCAVEVPLPPSTAPYTSEKGETWKFQENTQSQGNPFFPNIVVTIFNNPDLGGSGYVAGAVIISCKQNAEGDSLDEAAKKYADYFAAQNEKVPEEARITVKTSRKTTMWGHEVLVINLQGGMFNPEDEFYLVVTPAFEYVISKPQHSTDPFVRQTTQEILEKIIFR